MKKISLLIVGFSIILILTSTNAFAMHQWKCYVGNEFTVVQSNTNPDGTDAIVGSFYFGTWSNCSCMTCSSSHSGEIQSVPDSIDYNDVSSSGSNTGNILIEPIIPIPLIQIDGR